MKFHRWAVTALFVSTMGMSTGANAALYSRLSGAAVYDSDLDITWLADANFADTTGDFVGGLTAWSQANTWAASLTVDGISGWRLPTTLQPDSTCTDQSGSVSWGYGCTGSEMGHLFYDELGGAADQSIVTTHNSYYSLFANIQSGNYWSATAYAPNTGFAWGFDASNGYEYAYNKSDTYYVWAVHPGDVAVVPAPAAAWLFGSGLLGLVGLARRHRKAA